MVTNFDIQTIARSVGFKDLIIILDKKLLSLVKYYYKNNIIHPGYNELFSIKEIILGIKFTLQSKRNSSAVLLFNPNTLNWQKIEIEITKGKNCIYVNEIKFH